MPNDPFPFTGCSKEVTFTTGGQRTITLTGTESLQAKATDTISINVVHNPASAGPLVHISNPGFDFGIDPTVPFALSGQITAVGAAPTYRWFVKRNPDIVLGTGAAQPSGGLFHTNLNWTPAKDIQFRCGGSMEYICLSATDVANHIVTECRKVTINFPVC